MRLTARVLLLFTLAAHFAPLSSAARAGGPAAADLAVFAPGELIVGWEEDEAPWVAKSREAAVVSAFDLEPLPSRGLEGIGASCYRVRGAGDAHALAASIAALPGVRYAEPNAIAYPAIVPADPLYAGVADVATDLQRWALGGIAGNRVLNAEEAWDTTLGDPSVVIAVVDSGLDVDNPEFANLWVNPRETPGNGTDDDGNGYVDDVNGYDFHSRDGDIRPDLGDGIDNDFNDAADDSAPHGTIAASIIAAAHDGAGMAGAAPGCSLMTVKIFGDDGGVKVNDLIEAIGYAAKNGADVMNLSLSTPFKSEALGIAIRNALSKDVVVVAAAGNANSGAPHYPACYGNVISVGGSGSGLAVVAGASGSRGTINGRWPRSQFGLAAVDVVAPAVALGASVLTVAEQALDPERGEVGDTFYDVFEGTSFAAPYVSALAGLVVSRDKELFGRRTLRPADVKALLERTATDLPADYSNSPRSGHSWDARGRADFAAALAAMPGAGPADPRVTSVKHYQKRLLRVSGEGFSADSTVEINGTAVGAAAAFSFEAGRLEVEGTKRELGLGKRGTNTVVIVERGVRSPEFVF